MSDESPSEPLKHIRRPNVPWREDRVTECGKPESDVAAAIECDEAIAMCKKLGAQRASLFLCQTCTSTASRHSHYDRMDYGSTPAQAQHWTKDPVAVLRRYLERGNAFGSQRNSGEKERVEAELRAVGALVDAHRDEFDAFVEGAIGSPSLSDARARRARQARDGHRTRRL